jgi:hypothetical protein
VLHMRKNAYLTIACSRCVITSPPLQLLNSSRRPRRVDVTLTLLVNVICTSQTVKPHCHLPRSRRRLPGLAFLLSRTLLLNIVLCHPRLPKLTIIYPSHTIIPISPSRPRHLRGGGMGHVEQCHPTWAWSARVEHAGQVASIRR